MRTVLITGAAGNIGSKLTAHFRETGAYELRLLDLKATGDIHPADFGVWSEDWARHFAGVDTVLHLAGNPHGKASWAEVMHANVLGTQHVLRAAREHKVRRVIFASTNQVMLGYRFRDDVPLVTTDLPPAPLSPYGISKLFGEELGRGFAEETGISFIAFRIGYFQRGENLPGPHMSIGIWGQQMWLSNRDMIHATECAIEADDVPFAVVNLVSDVARMRWDLKHTKAMIGYVPQDTHDPAYTDKMRDVDAEARSTRMPPGTWFSEHFTPVEG